MRALPIKLLSVAILAAVPVLAGDPADVPVIRQIRYTLSLQNQTGRLLPEAECWVFAPVPETAYQVCRDIRSSQPFVLERDSLGNQVLHFTFRNLPPYDTRMISVEADLELHVVPRVSKGGVPSSFLGEDPLVQFLDPDFGRVVPAWKGTGVEEITGEMVEWVRRYLHDAGVIPRDLGSLEALRTRRGDCTEYSALTAALCRREGIPARPVGGFLCPRNMLLSPGRYHAWTEMYFNGVWNLADAQEGVRGNESAAYVAMRIAGPETVGLPGFTMARAGEGVQVMFHE